MDAWTFPAPPHVAHLKHINFEPGNPHTIFASIEVGGMLKSTDDGDTWTDETGDIVSMGIGGGQWYEGKSAAGKLGIIPIKSTYWSKHKA